jgi:hypothetical protein
MNALRQRQLTEDSLRKPPDKERKAVSTSLEKLRARTDYDKGEGWSALPHAAFVDLLKLSSGEVCLRFIWAINIALSSVSARSPKEAWDSWTEFRSTQEWAEVTASNVRDIQRQLAEMQERGMIGVKQVKNGTVKYSISLLYRKWGKLESYATWKGRRVVAIDESAAELAEDEAPAEISKDAVHLTKKPQRIAPGRASRAVKVNVGVNSFKFQSTDSRVDLIHDAVIQSGCLIVSVTSQKGESEAKGEDKGNAERHACRALPANEGIKNTPTNEGSTISHPRAAELIKLFDPILAKSASRLLSGDSASLKAACEAVADCDHDFLVKFAVQRAERPVKSPLHVKTICAEALASWKASKVLTGAGLPTKEQIDAMCKRDEEALKKARAEVSQRYKK